MTGRRPTIRKAAVAAAVFALALLHLLLLFAPDAVLKWNRHASRLLLLEATGFAAGAICSMVVISKWRRHLFDRAGDDDRALTDTVSLTLVLVSVVSGVALAVAYRWASSWSVVTLTPYAVSLARLAPRVELIAATPFVVRLHVFCSFPLVALLVFMWLGSVAHAALDRIFERIGAALRHLRVAELWREEEN
jgi:nitrate reductase gamma subunit